MCIRDRFNNSSINAMFPHARFGILHVFKGAVDSWREAAVRFGRGSISAGSQFPTPSALYWSSTNLYVPSQGHVYPCCRLRDPSWLAMECQSVWLQAWWLQVWPRFELVTPPYDSPSGGDSALLLLLLTAIPRVSFWSISFTIISTSPVLAWHMPTPNMKTLTVPEYPLQIGCQALAL